MFVTVADEGSPKGLKLNSNDIVEVQSSVKQLFLVVVVFKYSVCRMSAIASMAENAGKAQHMTHALQPEVSETSLPFPLSL